MTEEDNCRQLYKACTEGDIPTVSGLVDKVSDINWHNPGYPGHTFLMEAAYNGHTELCKLLLDKGADLKSKSRSEETVLHTGCKSGNLDLVKYLVERDPGLLTQKDDADWNCLHSVCYGAGKWPVIHYLLNNGLSLYDASVLGTIPLDMLMLYRDTNEDKKYSLQQLKARGEEFLKPEDITKIPDADLQSSNTSPIAAAGTDTVVPTEGGGAVPTAATDPSSEKEGTQPLDGNTVDGTEQRKIDYRPYLEKASINGTVNTKKTNLGLGGASGIGKTSTLRLLTDQKPDTQHDSTDVLKPIEYFSEDIDKSSDEEEEEDSSTESSSDDEDANKSDDEDTATDKSPTAVVKSKPRPAKQYLIVATKKNKWNPATQQALLHRLASCVVTLATENESSKSSTHKSRKKKGPLSMERKLFFHRKPTFSEDDPAPMGVANPTSDAAKNLQKMSFDDLEAAQKIIDFIESNEDLEKLGATHFVSASDTGGQAAFIDIAPALMRFNSVNLVLFRLDERLDGLAKFFYSVKGKVVGCEKRQITTKSLIYSMIASKSKIQKPDIKGMEVLQTQNKSKFMIIGTHLDQYEKLPKDSRESLEEKEKVLKVLLHEYKDCIIPNGENIIFSLNTLSRDKKTRKMAATIRELAMRYFIETEVPVSWYIFQLAINEIKVSKKKGMIPISKFIEVGKYIKIFEEEVRASLRYFHESSNVLYYPDVLPDVVFATPQFLFEKISELVSATLDEMTDVAANWEDDLEQFKKYGIFTMSFLKHVCKGFEDGLFTAEDFFKLMTHLFIISQLPNDDTPDDIKYFMPSVLQMAEKPFEGLPKSEIDVEPLLFTWNNTVPNGLFPSLVTSMLSSKGICHFKMSSKVAQYRNKITFNCPRYASVVTLIDGNSFIAIAATCKVQNHCVKVREAVLDGIDKVVKRFDWQPSVANPEEVFPCKALSCIVSNHSVNPFTHFSEPEVSYQLLVCKEDSSQTVDLTGAHSIWYRGTYKSSEPVTLPSIYKFLKGRSADWDDIGRELGVSINDRKQVQNDLRLTGDNARLEAVIDKWLESSTATPTWSQFVDILNNSLNYRAIAQQVQTFIN